MDNSSMLPNFLIVGAARAGTTSLYKYLTEHPEIFMSEIKEPCFFLFADEDINFSDEKPNFVTKYEDYLKLFKKSGKYKLRGESSTPYLHYYKKTIKNIKKYIPAYKDLKIIIILRNPIERAFSQYMLNVSLTRENLSFKDAIKAEKTRMEQNCHFDFFYIDRGFHYKQVKAYMEHFKNVRLFFYEDLQKNSSYVLKEIAGFLGVNENYKCNIDRKYNKSGVPKIKLLAKLMVSDNIVKRLLIKLLPESAKYNIKNMIYMYALKREEMDGKTRSHLIAIYEKDIDNLSRLIDRDLSAWLK